MVRSAICVILILTVHIIGGYKRSLNSTLLTCHREKNGQKYFELIAKKEQGLPYQFTCSDGCGFLFEKEEKACLECCKVERKTTTPSLTKNNTTEVPKTTKTQDKKKKHKVGATTRENLVAKSEPKQKVENTSSGKTPIAPTLIGVFSGTFLLLVVIAVIIVKCKNRRKEETEREAQQMFREHDLPYGTQETASLSPKEEVRETSV